VEQSKEQLKAFMLVEYNLDVQEITVAGDYAFEWGTYHGIARSLTGGETLKYDGKFMWILQRQNVCSRGHTGPMGEPMLIIAMYRLSRRDRRRQKHDLYS
jgi:hypothetical protein